MQFALLVIIVLIGIVSYKTSEKKYSVKDISLCAIFIVLSQVLSVLSITLPVFGIPGVKIGFAGIPLIIMGFSVNPFLAFIGALANDIVGLVITPTAFPFLGFTLNTVLTVMLSSLIYRKRSRMFNKNNIVVFKIFQVMLVLTIFLTIIFTNTATIDSVTFEITTNIKILLIVLTISIFVLTYFLSIFVKKRYKNNLNNFYLSIFISIVINLVVYLGLTPFWLEYMYGIPIILSQFIRAVKSIVMIPMFSVIIYYLNNLVEKMK